MHVIQPPRLRGGNGGHGRALYFILPITRNDIQHESSADGLVDLREGRCLKVARLYRRYIFAMDAMKTRAR